MLPPSTPSLASIVRGDRCCGFRQWHLPGERKPVFVVTLHRLASDRSIRTTCVFVSDDLYLSSSGLLLDVTKLVFKKRLSAHVRHRRAILEKTFLEEVALDTGSGPPSSPKASLRSSCRRRRVLSDTAATLSPGTQSNPSPNEHGRRPLFLSPPAALLPSRPCPTAGCF